MLTKFTKILSLSLISFLLTSWPKNFANEVSISSNDPLIGPRVDLPSFWVGDREVDDSIDILVLAGHADSQGINGAGTAGEAVDLNGAEPMDRSIRDELFWNLLICQELVSMGKRYGLNMSFYDPGLRTIIDGNNYRTNWSKGYRHSINGGYALEIHFDAYGRDGFGSGLIPAVTDDLNLIDESLANEFGRYPLLFRGGLGAPRRQIRILEIGKLEGELEKRLRDPSTRENTIKIISLRIINSILNGLSKEVDVN